MNPWDNTKTRSEFVNERPGCLIGSFCPECGGDVADDPRPDRIEHHELIRTKPVLCLYCGLRMTHADPVAWPGSTIKALDWSRAEWQVEEEKRVYLLADVVDQVLGRLTFSGEIT